jgi:hypothetical protein
MEASDESSLGPMEEIKTLGPVRAKKIGAPRIDFNQENEGTGEHKFSKKNLGAT